MIAFYVRLHIGRDDKTYAEKALIEVMGRDKWLTLIQNSTTEPIILVRYE
ncbi:MAG: hypothetical protein ABSD99_02650 [Candidatus Bathyarchaeia archaeon]